ncbi:nuclear transport factor 2 family protein [Priestia megaterium]|uniref:nuclear transport factor 2 family protein n=1 Tax=Priestia megaterium TaxID=1404 RepID=UPI0023DC7BE3|nr:nuclear transport factor 2 family protein [Priestia megaterium]MDF2014697.1 nuclear transport factor 2 family protein [Priestia megaterium]
MQQHEMEKEIQKLVDIEAIKQLKYTYAEICDDNHNPNRICSVFTEDAIWDGGEQFGKFSGHDQIREAFADFSKSIDLSRHHMTNPIITVDGDKATGQWYTFGVFRKNSKDSILAGSYFDEYIKVEGKWLIKKLIPLINFDVALDEGRKK